MKTKLFFIVLPMLFVMRHAESQTNIVLQPGAEGKDAVAHGFWPDRNLADSNDLYIMAWTFSGGNPASVRSYLEFDLGFLSPQAEILDAKLSLYYQVGIENPGLTNYGDNQSYIRRVTSEWNERTITWNNQPQTTDENSTWMPSSSSPTQDYLDIDVTDLVRDIVADPENGHGFCIRLATEIEYRALCFATGDHVQTDLHPKLEIEYIDCEPLEVSFSFMITEQTVEFEPVSPGAIAWMWDFGDGYQSTLSNPSHTYQSQGSYLVCLEASDSCGTAEYCEMIDVCDRPLAGFSYESEGLNVYFSDTSWLSSGWQWSFGDGYYSDLQHPWHTYDTSGYYEVCLKTWNDCASDSVCRVMFIDFSALPEDQLPHFSMFPNPVKDELGLRFKSDGDSQVSFIDLNGKTIRLITIEGNKEEELTIDTRDLPAGVYFIRVSSGSMSLIEKIVKI